MKDNKDEILQLIHTKSQDFKDGFDSGWAEGFSQGYIKGFDIAVQKVLSRIKGLVTPNDK